MSLSSKADNQPLLCGASIELGITGAACLSLRDCGDRISEAFTEMDLTSVLTTLVVNIVASTFEPGFSSPSTFVSLDNRSLWILPLSSLMVTAIWLALTTSPLSLASTDWAAWVETIPPAIVNRNQIMIKVKTTNIIHCVVNTHLLSFFEMRAFTVTGTCRPLSVSVVDGPFDLNDVIATRTQIFIDQRVVTQRRSLLFAPLTPDIRIFMFQRMLHDIYCLLWPSPTRLCCL